MFSFTNYEGEKHFCKHCLHCSSSKDLLERHQKDCLQLNGTQAITMPNEGSKIFFKNHHKILPVPFDIYADLTFDLTFMQKRFLLTIRRMFLYNELPESSSLRFRL